jgi:hypothetical protein
MMKRIRIQHSLLAGVAMLTVALAVPLVVAAEEGSEATTTNTETESETTDSIAMKRQEAIKKSETERAAAKAKAEELRAKMKADKEAAKGRLTEAKQKVCDARKKNITTLMSRNGENAQKHFNQITTISERVQKFYTEKGKVLANYDDLVADVNAKKTLAQAAVDSLKSSSASFDCSAENPKGTLDAFKVDLRSKTVALIDYRTAVKNLIVGVKSVQGKTESAKGGTE